MKMTSISVTDAARNFADCVNRAHYQNMTFILLKNGSPVARLVPDGAKAHTAGDLAKALSGIELTQEEFKAWGRDLRKARKTLKPQADKWQ
jgi:antitoxin (DNA-binding transcriptional repressor) of toxin-antitoxin stability system